MEVDIDEFRPYFSEYEMDQAQKDEFIRILWNIMCAFVDLGWGVSSIHFSLPELTDFSTPDTENEVHSATHISIKEHIRAAFTDPPKLEDS
jgi:hypothetical protein